MKLKFSLHFLFFGGISFLFSSCAYHTPEGPTFNVTQAQLDNAVIIPSQQDTAIIGDPFNGFPGDTVTIKHKLRDLFASIPVTKDVTVGTVITRKAYYYTGDEYNRDSLINIVVMVKREEGYYPEGGDWEYMDIKHSKDTNYEINPNGLLPDISNTMARGRLTKCSSCHANAGNKFLFHRN